jgi:hypothetical protein
VLRATPQFFIFHFSLFVFYFVSPKAPLCMQGGAFALAEAGFWGYNGEKTHRRDPA